MKQVKKWTVSFIIAVLFLSTLSTVLPYQANAAEKDELGLDTGAAILVDAKTGEILYEKIQMNSLVLPPCQK
ncbi:hypothetical protein AAHH67_01010 [Niallia circulans]